MSRSTLAPCLARYVAASRPTKQICGMRELPAAGPKSPQRSRRRRTAQPGVPTRPCGVNFQYPRGGEGWGRASRSYFSFRAASIMAKMPARSASGNVGQASISRAKLGSICVSRAKEWAKGNERVAVTGLSVSRCVVADAGSIPGASITLTGCEKSQPVGIYRIA